MTFIADNVEALPSGTTDVYGDGTILRIKKGASGNSGGVSGGRSVITMHDGSILESRVGRPFATNQQIYIDDAELSLDSSLKYVQNLTLANGSQVTASGNGAKSQMGYLVDASWNVTGTGVSTCAVKLELYSNGNTLRTITFNVEDTVAGDGADFIANGDITLPASGHQKAVFVKSGAGTMSVGGNFLTTNQAAQVHGGTLLINKSDSTTANVKFSLQGGALGFAAGTANTTGAITLTKSSEISVGTGASLTIGNVTVPDGTMLSINGDVLNRNVKISTQLDAATLSRIRLNGKKPIQTGDGYLCRKGLIISFF